MSERAQEHELPAVGKISPENFAQIIKPRLGAANPDVLVGPRHGVDIGIVRIGGDQVMAISTDPFFIVPDYGWQRAGWFAVNILASDAATSGLRPTYLTVDLNLPLAMTGEQLGEMWSAVDDACRELGMAIVTGHTARYEGCNYPMVGGATVISVGPEANYLTPAMAQVGDAVIVTTGAAIEATGLFGVTFPQRIARELGVEVARAAEDLFYQMTVVTDAMTAVSVGVRGRGVTAMHDATECGVWGGLYEIAEASGVGMVIDQSAVLVRPEVRAICDHFGMDPYSAISEGTLLLTCRPAQAQAVLDRLNGAGIQASQVGEVVPAEQGIRLVESGHERPLAHPRVDPFWVAYGKALAEGAG